MFAMTNRCLLVVDVQEGLFSTPRHDGDALIVRLNRLASLFRAAGNPVIYVQHCGAEGDALHPSQPGYALFSALEVESDDLRIAKESCDAFLNTTLAATLENLGTRQLVVTGFATEFCVDTTIRSALAHGFEAIVPADGHTTADRPHLPAHQIIEHHNATWPWLVSPVGGARMTRCADLG